MKSLSLISVVFSCLSCGLRAEVENPSAMPRVGLLLNADGRHRDEFDNAVKSLGWTAERFPSKPEVMGSLPARLGEFDLLIAAPLFNMDKKNLPGADRELYRKFLNDGGMIAITDGSYAGAREWLADIDPALGGLKEGKCDSSQWEVKGVTSDAEPCHPLRFFPSRITEPNSWPHFHKPADGSKWQVVANCSEGYPVTFAQRIGKGMVSISTLRQPSPKQLENFYACLLLTRAGIGLKSFDLPEPVMGEGRLRLELSEAGGGKSASFIYEITPQGGKPERFEKPIDGTSFELSYRFSQRGAVKTRLLMKRDGSESLLLSRNAELPPLLTVKPGVNRGIYSTMRRLQAASFDISLAPEKDELAGAELRIRVSDQQGKEVSSVSRILGEGEPLAIRESVALDRNLPQGVYSVKATLTKGKELGVGETTVKIFAPAAGQTILDEDNTILADGKPYFPLGLYHVPGADYEAVAKLGINTVQYWTWDGQAGLEKAASQGLKVIFELNHKSEEIVRKTVDEHGSHPSILMWYGLDEPSEGDHSKAEMMRRTFNEVDEQRPVYLVSCRPDLYREQAGFSDVFAVDKYGSPQNVLDCITKANGSVDSRKPVIFVPGVFGKETAAELRATAYIVLAGDARGILWYPWAQTGGGPVGIGLKNSPEQQAVIKELCLEIRALTPALTAVNRVPFQSTDGKLRGIHCKDGKGHYVLLVNSTPEKIEATAVIPGSETADGEFRDFFEKKQDKLSIERSGFRISLEPYETRVFWRE